MRIEQPMGHLSASRPRGRQMATAIIDDGDSQLTDQLT